MRNGALNIAIKAARAAGNVILRALPKRDSLVIHEKAHLDFVTEVDRLAEAEIIKELRRAFPTHGFLGEESGQVGPTKPQWVIDPLDGTSNFLRGFPHFSVSIALVEKGEPVLGVVFDPLRDELFTAEKGRGALLNDRRLRVAPRRGIEGALIATGFPFRQRKLFDDHLGMVKALLKTGEDLRRTGSAALDLAYVACGRFDAYFEMGLQPWDIAAGTLLVREAGGQVTDMRGGDAFMTNGHIVAANLHVGGELRAAIEPFVGGLN
jgi:myo-inositol-1(or 4)-monophosphatase